MKIVKLVKYQLNVFFKGTGFIMPFITVIVFLYGMYTIQPLSVVSGFVMTGVILFYIMIWIGITAAQQEDEVSEQILLFKMNSAAAYYASKLLFLVVIAAFFTVFCVAVPVSQYFINGGQLFLRELTAGDIVNSLFLIGSTAVSGILFGNFFHPRIMKNRQMAYSILALVCVVMIARPGLANKLPFLQAFLWLLPPAMQPSQIFADADFFSYIEVMKMSLTFLVYGTVFGSLKSILCHRARF